MRLKEILPLFSSHNQVLASDLDLLHLPAQDLSPQFQPTRPIPQSAVGDQLMPISHLSKRLQIIVPHPEIGSVAIDRVLQTRPHLQTDRIAETGSTHGEGGDIERQARSPGVDQVHSAGGADEAGVEALVLISVEWHGPESPWMP